MNGFFACLQLPFSACLRLSSLFCTLYTFVSNMDQLVRIATLKEKRGSVPHFMIRWNCPICIAVQSAQRKAGFPAEDAQGRVSGHRAGGTQGSEVFVLRDAQRSGQGRRDGERGSKGRICENPDGTLKPCCRSWVYSNRINYYSFHRGIVHNSWIMWHLAGGYCRVLRCLLL